MDQCYKRVRFNIASSESGMVVNFPQKSSALHLNQINLYSIKKKMQWNETERSILNIY